jgi:hypothetical protein
MTKLSDIEVDSTVGSFNQTILSSLKGVLGVSDEDLVVPEDTGTSGPVAPGGPSLINLLVLVILITVVTSGSTMFVANNLVENPYLLNGIHALVIVLLYWIFCKLHG